MDVDLAVLVVWGCGWCLVAAEFLIGRFFDF